MKTVNIVRCMNQFRISRITLNKMLKYFFFYIIKKNCDRDYFYDRVVALKAGFAKSGK